LFQPSFLAGGDTRSRWKVLRRSRRRARRGCAIPGRDGINNGESALFRGGGRAVAPDGRERCGHPGIGQCTRGFLDATVPRRHRRGARGMGLLLAARRRNNLGLRRDINGSGHKRVAPLKCIVIEHCGHVAHGLHRLDSTVAKNHAQRTLDGARAGEHRALAQDRLNFPSTRRRHFFFFFFFFFFFGGVFLVVFFFFFFFFFAFIFSVRLQSWSS
jgi:hypothetical protein